MMKIGWLSSILYIISIGFILYWMFFPFGSSIAYLIIGGLLFAIATLILIVLIRQRSKVKRT